MLKWPTILGLLVVLCGPPAIASLGRRLSDEMVTQLTLQLAFCGLALFIVLLVVRFEHLPLASIGIRTPGWSTLVTAVALFSAGILVQILVIGPLVGRWGDGRPGVEIATLATLPAWYRIVLGATGGMVEETLYRGYAVERLATITGRRWLGATLATLIFAAAHIPSWGIRFAFLADLPAGILLVSFYLWRRDLVANMLAHSGGIILAMFTVVPRSV